MSGCRSATSRCCCGGDEGLDLRAMTGSYRGSGEASSTTRNCFLA